MSWKIIKNRYRLSTKIQMNFELSFPMHKIGKCRCTTNNAHEVKTKKVSLSTKGIVFSDTIPLSWFTSSVFIPWEKVGKILVADPACDGLSNTPISSEFEKQSSEYCTIELNDPQEMTIDLPWSEEFTHYLQKNKRF